MQEILTHNFKSILINFLWRVETRKLRWVLLCWSW